MASHVAYGQPLRMHGEHTSPPSARTHHFSTSSLCRNWQHNNLAIFKEFTSHIRALCSLVCWLAFLQRVSKAISTSTVIQLWCLWCFDPLTPQLKRPHISITYWKTIWDLHYPVLNILYFLGGKLSSNQRLLISQSCFISTYLTWDKTSNNKCRRFPAILLHIIIIIYFLWYDKSEQMWQ